MKIPADRIEEIGHLILQCDDVADSQWHTLSFVFDITDGATSNSGFLYKGEKVTPVIAEIEEHPLLLDDTILDLRKEIAEKNGHKFFQFLIQLEKETGRIKVDLEFDNPDRWKITPGKLKEIRETLRPNFT